MRCASDLCWMNDAKAAGVKPANTILLPRYMCTWYVNFGNTRKVRFRYLACQVKTLSLTYFIDPSVSWYEWKEQIRSEFQLFVWRFDSTFATFRSCWPSMLRSSYLDLCIRKCEAHWWGCPPFQQLWPQEKYTAAVGRSPWQYTASLRAPAVIHINHIIWNF